MTNPCPLVLEPKSTSRDKRREKRDIVRFRVPKKEFTGYQPYNSDFGIIAKMDQEGNSTASFGSSNNMTSTETANVAMVGQTVAGDTMSSMGESPAQSSDSALEMFPRRGPSGGVGQERSAEQSLPAPILPTIQDQDGGSEDLGTSQSMLSQPLPAVPNGERSLFVTPRRSRSGSVTPVKKVQAFGKIISPRSSPKGGMERKSGQSTPADFRG